MDLVEVTLPNGYIVQAIDQSKTIIDEIWFNNMYDRHLTIESGMKILDLGANLGFFSLYAASKGAMVYGFEPEKQNYAIYKYNIAKNDLQQQIIPFNLAVAKDKKKIDIFLNDFNEQFASGMVTTSINHLKKYIKMNYTKQVVSCISLKEIIDKINGNKIDLLKIDCEGAEYEILQSAPKHYFKRIDKIVMETHDTYPEKDIFYLLKELGFKIIGYEKLSGVYNTGYVCAINEILPAKEELKNPVAIITMQPFGIVNEEIQIDSSLSFSGINKENKLIYNWFITGKPIQENHQPVFNYVFKKPGLHDIRVQVIDDNMVSEEIKRIWIFSENYFNDTVDFELSDNNEENIFDIQGEKSFVIKKEYLPGYWNPDFIFIGICFPENSNSGGLFRFNNEEKIINNIYTEIKIKNFCHNVDLKFILSTPLLQRIQIKWWIDIKRKKKKSNISRSHDNSIQYLNDCSEPLICMIRQGHRFLLSFDMLPTHWEPENIVIGIKIEDPDKNSVVVLKKKKYNVQSGWQEIRLKRKEVNSDIYLDVFLHQEESKVKIVWWAE